MKVQISNAEIEVIHTDFEKLMLNGERDMGISTESHYYLFVILTDRL